MTAATPATSRFSPDVVARADPNPAEVSAALTEDVVGYCPARHQPVYGHVAVDTGEFRELTGHDVPRRDSGGTGCP